MPSPAAHPHPRLLSPKALRLHHACPKRYEFEYLLKPEVEDEPSAALVIGNAVHRAMALLYKLPGAERDAGAAEQALRRAWSQIDRAGAFSCDEEEAAWGRLAIEWLQLYCAEYELTIEPLIIEGWVRARLPRGYLVGGLVDRVDLAGDGSGVEVIDYKTGRLSEEELSSDLSARLYALAVSRMTGRPVARVRFLYLQYQAEREWLPTPEELAATEVELATRAELIYSADEFDPVPGDHCRWCRYRHLCPAADQMTLNGLAEPTNLPF